MYSPGFGRKFCYHFQICTPGREWAIYEKIIDQSLIIGKYLLKILALVFFFKLRVNIAFIFVIVFAGFSFFFTITYLNFS